MWPEPQAEVIAAQSGLTNKGQNQTILWGPWCPEDHNLVHCSDKVKVVLDAVDLNKFFELIFDGSHKKAVAMFLWPAIDASCDSLMSYLDAYVRGIIEAFADPELPQTIACAKALVFYRRHSHQLKTRLTDIEVNILEAACDNLRSAFHLAGHSLRSPRRGRRLQYRG
jgi:hypothetical protein